MPEKHLVTLAQLGREGLLEEGLGCTRPSQTQCPPCAAVTLGSSTSRWMLLRRETPEDGGEWDKLQCQPLLLASGPQPLFLVTLLATAFHSLLVLGRHQCYAQWLTWWCDQNPSSEDHHTFLGPGKVVLLGPLGLLGWSSLRSGAGLGNLFRLVSWISSRVCPGILLTFVPSPAL